MSDNSISVRVAGKDLQFQNKKFKKHFFEVQRLFDIKLYIIVINLLDFPLSPE